MSAETPSPPTKTADVGRLILKLRRLWKGTLYTASSAVYVAIVAGLFLRHGWRTALLALFLILLAQLLRYIANDVDHIGWVLKTSEATSEKPQASRYQKQLLMVLFSSIQAVNLGLVFDVWLVSRGITTGYVFVGLAACELIFARIRSINRKIEFEPATYGYSDGGILASGPDRAHPDRYVQPERTEDEKLAILREMAEKGEISRSAYEGVRDQVLIKRVMQGHSMHSMSPEDGDRCGSVTQTSEPNGVVPSERRWL